VSIKKDTTTTPDTNENIFVLKLKFLNIHVTPMTLLSGQRRRLFFSQMLIQNSPQASGAFFSVQDRTRHSKQQKTSNTVLPHKTPPAEYTECAIDEF
jgi:hypothetical protein